MNEANIISIGVILIIIGFLAVSAGSIIHGLRGNGDSKFSVVGFIGFIPFGFSDDRRLLWASVLLAAIMVAGYLVFFAAMRK